MSGDRLGPSVCEAGTDLVKGSQIVYRMFLHINEVDYQSSMNVIVKSLVWVGGRVWNIFVIIASDLWAAIYFFEA